MASTPHSHYNFMKRPFKHPLSPTKNRCLWGIFMSCALLPQGTRVCHPIGVLPLCEGAAVSLTPVIRKHLLCTNRMPENWQTDQRLPPQTSLSKQCELRQHTMEILHTEQSRVCTRRDRSEAHKEPAHYSWLSFSICTWEWRLLLCSY